MTTLNPHMLPKVRSSSYLGETRHMPCTLRLASYLGRSCASQETVVPCHLPVFGKGTATKVTDLAVVAGCMACHDILDGRDRKALDYIMAKYPAALNERMLLALVETQARLVAADYVWGKDWEII